MSGEEGRGREGREGERRWEERQVRELLSALISPTTNWPTWS